MIRRIIAATLLACATAFAQSTPAPHKPLAFEVVSLRPNKAANWAVSWATTPDGYRVTGQSIWQTIMIAYFPQGTSYWQGGRLGGMTVWPDWLNVPYTIDARVSSADRAAWQKQGMGLEKVPMLREMLQTMLADRCKFAFHRVPGYVEGFALVATKRGPKVTTASAGATLPAVGMRLPDGGIAVGSDRGQPLQWAYHSASMADLVGMMSMWGYPVVDHTGLKGRYDFVMRCGSFDPDHPDWGCAGNPRDAMLQWDLGSLGLSLEPTKIPIDTLVVDHIEKPSEN